ncbi:MAG: ABC transporter substrate-binding protein, partial [Pararhizobium sp.]
MPVPRMLVVAFLACALAWPGGARAAETVRVGILQYGTVNWVLDVIKRHGFDRQENVAIAPLALANNQATTVALQAGRVDVIVTDWLWVSRQRAAGRRYTFVPF